MIQSIRHFEDGSAIVRTLTRYTVFHSDGDVTVFKIKTDAKGNYKLDEGGMW